MTAQPSTIKKTLGHSDFDQLVSQLQNTLHSLQDQVNNRTQDLEIASQIARHISRELNLDALLQSAVDLTRDGFNLYHAHIYLLDKEGQELVLAAGAGEVGRKLVAQSHHIPLNREQSIVARAARTGEGVVINDVHQTPNFMPNSLLPDTRAEMAIPMVVGDKVVGVLDVQSDTTDRFSDEDVRIKGILAEQIAIAVQNAYNFEAEKRQQAQLEQAQHETETLYKLGQAINNAADYNEIIAAVKEHLAYPEASLISISLFDGEDHSSSNNLTIVAEWSSGQSFQGYTFTLEQYAVLKFMERNKITVCNSLDELDDISRETMKQMRLGAYILAPLVSTDKWFGLISICSNQSHQHTPQQVRLLSAASEQISAAVTRFRLTNQTIERAAELNTMYKLGADINSAANYDDIIAAVREHLAHADATLVTISLFDSDDYTTSNNLTIFAEWNKGGQSFQGYTFPIEQYPVLKFMERDKISVTDDVADLDETTREVMYQMGLRAFLLAPLVSNDKWFGLIGISSAQPHKHTPEQLRLVTAASKQIAAAVTRFRLLQETHERAAELDTMYKLGADINNAAGYDDIITTVREHLAHTEATLVTISLFDGNDYTSSKNLTIFAEWSSGGQSFQGYTFPIEQYPVLKFMERDRISVTDDVAELDETTREVMYQMGLRAFLLAPLVFNERWFGLIGISSAQPHKHTPQQLRLVEAASEQIAAAVTRFRLMDQVQLRALELETVATVTADVTRNLNLKSLLQEVADLTKERFGLYHAHIYLLDADGKSLVLASGAGEVGRILTEKGHSIPLDREHSLVARAARTHEAVIVNDVTQNSYFMPNALLPDTKAEMAVPMLLGDEVIGVLDAQANVTNRFTPQDIQIKSILAGQVAAAVKNARAFEQEREAAERLREVDRLKSEFLANMSHELRTPLNSIIGYAEVLIDGIDGDLSEEAQLDVNDIHASGKHLLAIINDILDLAKIEAGQMMIDHQPVNVNEVVRDVVHTAQILVKEKPVTVEVNITDALPPVLGDTTRLRQVILNLVSNAVKFTESGSVVVETGCHKDAEVFVKVTDTGMGISPEGLKLIFERFSQVDGSATRRKEGTGLGLTITRELVHMHGGEIYAESKVGAGSTFWFTLPVHVPQGNAVR